ncbi:hypothetical protein XA68_11136 [Ophiocordyceps unilateralis]|uniref:DUF7580 domain-containing protein n=1 Tax=Ophiocordyceps unilateralis TaxID=268505 RepID=A0A2A9PFQ5_OPHUN|nr:hypothetical protein XA68_11136 [Ophiocordyceps unilateralis]
MVDSRRVQPRIPLRKAELISLSEGMLETSPLVPLKQRICLSLVLAHLALNTLGHSWYLTPEDKQGLYFLQEGGQMRLLPVLHTRLPADDEPRPEPLDFKGLRLALGVLLLEIFCQKSTDVGSDPASGWPSRPAAGTDASWYEKVGRLALQKCSTTSWDVNEPFREAVLACLRGDADHQTRDETDDAETSFVSFILSKVIAPLEIELECCWGDEDIDELISRLSVQGLPSAPEGDQESITLLPRRSSNYRHALSRRHPEGSGISYLGAGTALQANWNATARDSSWSNPKRQTSTYDSEDVAVVDGAFLTRPSQTSSEAWFNKVQPLLDVLSPRSQEVDKIYRRVRIAVIDTGISPKHQLINEFVVKNFVETPNERIRDDPQHGTDSVDLILRMLDTAQIYVARVFQAKEGDELTPGFEHSHAKLAEVIRRASAADPEILIFAAAANWANTQFVAYPARLTGQVFCIFSMNGALRNTRDYNPNALENADNFALLGQDVRPNPNPMSREGLSGTSVATAIAAGLAGRILDFTRHADSRKHLADRHRKMVATKMGLREIFHLLSQDHKDLEYRCVAPWDLLPPEQLSTATQARQDTRFKICGTIERALWKLK